ncbi:MAG TPA: cyclic nucleotide-binding domain-containing protein [Burkholderiales bacterium]|jgi:CRP-like cAMP-binding protein|nr:cyclic nucleotide-binding domain-containing protein [Burkholderiales bacterium]
MNLAELFKHEKNLVVAPPGQAIFRTGEKGTVMYVLMQGSVDVYIGNKIVETAEPGAILGEMALIDQAARSATVIAKGECRLLPIDIERFDHLIQQAPNFARHVMKVMADRLRRMDGKILEGQTEKH